MVCKDLAGRGAKVIDCDLLGHQAYHKGSTTFDQLVATFGEELINAESGEIDRSGAYRHYTLIVPEPTSYGGAMAQTDIMRRRSQEFA